MVVPLLAPWKRATRARGGQLLLKTHAQKLSLAATVSKSLVKLAMTETHCLEMAVLLLALSRPVTLVVAGRRVPKTLALNVRVATTALEVPQQQLAPTVSTLLVELRALSPARLLCVETVTGAQTELGLLVVRVHGSLREQERPQHLAPPVKQDIPATELVLRLPVPLIHIATEVGYIRLLSLFFSSSPFDRV